MHSRLIFWSERYIKQIKYIFCAAFVDFVSVDVTVVSSLKGFKSRFILSFTHFKEFKNAKKNIVIGKNWDTCFSLS